jgi:transcriptional regulator with XRE-family HTH domain
MKLLIGENIKRLRRERDLTQEELAEQLGVSFQSISRWETGACYPDMELVPSIAAFFGVTVDSLMGLDAAREETEVKKVLDEFRESISRGEIDRCIAIAREGLKNHPGSYEIMNKLMYALFVASDDTGNIPDWKENLLR